MTSCPGEPTLVRLVDGELAPAREAAVLDHLVACDDCRSLLGRSEAALRYALGGLADAGERPLPVEPQPAEGPAAHPTAAPRRPAHARPLALVGTLLAAVVVLVGVLHVARSQARTRIVVRPTVTYTTRIQPAPVDAATETDRLDALLARAERLAAPAPSRLTEERDLLALGALAAAETRGDVLGTAPEAAGLRDVVATFPGTSAARVAAQRLAALEQPR